MQARDIPPQVFTDLTVGRQVETHDFHEYIRQLMSRTRSLDLYNDGVEVRTCEVRPNLWLRLSSDSHQDTRLAVVRALDPGARLGSPIDHPHITDAQNFPLYESLAVLSSGEWPHRHDATRPTLFMRYSLGDINALHVETAEAVLGATGIIHQMARRAFDLFNTTRLQEHQTLALPDSADHH